MQFQVFMWVDKVSFDSIYQVQSLNVTQEYRISPKSVECRYWKEFERKKQKV